MPDTHRFTDPTGARTARFSRHRREGISYPFIDKVLEMGDGDAAIGTVRAFEAGVLDIPWSPNRGVKSRVLPARDADGYLRIVDSGFMPFPSDVMQLHEERLRTRAARDNIPYGPDLAVSSVYEIAEPLAKLLPDTWAA